MKKVELLQSKKQGHRIIHTADWHLGLNLCKHNCLNEQRQFLQWLLQQVQEVEADALIIAGDIFDTLYVGPEAQKVYYNFLAQLVGTQCKDVFIVAGNHDSQSILSAPKELLEFLNVHVVGLAPLDHSEIVFALADDGGDWANVVAVPHLRAENMRINRASSGSFDREKELSQAIKDYYSKAVAVAKAKNSQLPIIMTGHQTAGNSDAEAVIGNLRNISTSVFPEDANYVALGHIHHAGFVGQSERVRYSGSPYPTSFDDDSAKSLTLLEITPDGELQYDEIPVANFMNLYQVTADAEENCDKVEEICKKVAECIRNNPNALIEVKYKSAARLRDLPDRLEALLQNSGTQAQIVSCVYDGVFDGAENPEQVEREVIADLSELQPETVLRRYLKQINREMPDELMALFRQCVTKAREEIAARKAKNDVILGDQKANIEQQMKGTKGEE